uniref:dolichol kinase n=1 Tax=Evadne anonyx TaxID=141404 RepID=A0A9N6WQC7_9CRUS|nr:EOG090X0BFL [Evadne anonyx]
MMSFDFDVFERFALGTGAGLTICCTIRLKLVAVGVGVVGLSCRIMRRPAMAIKILCYIMVIKIDISHIIDGIMKPSNYLQFGQLAIECNMDCKTSLLANAFRVIVFIASIKYYSHQMDQIKTIVEMVVNSQNIVLLLIAPTFSYLTLMNRQSSGNVMLFNIFSIGAFFLLCASLQNFTIISISSTVLVSFITRNVYSYYQVLVRLFPLSFSVGEAILVVQGTCCFLILTTGDINFLRQNPTTVRLTILRKYFHGVVVAIFMPGILLDPELLFLASVVALCGFLFIEAIRLFNFEPIGPFLEKSLSQFLDSKDEGLLILTHIYLLVGCSLPIWIFPNDITSNKTDILVLSSGIISLGIGDTAASVGGSLWGKTKILNSPKSIEGATCSILAEIIFVAALNYFGLFGTTSYFPWVRFVSACVITSITEAVTTQVDNLVLPLVMYIILMA